ncbi:unnamed protein product [Protopolystoma xenopodis]|uniref:Uncharacterized protein n=1 Tax=Protopolystoma xenopodis TaxID=117903 RepID=A0A3S5FEB5_9PLAT|nr:unnamed protein product [Protopolystoma xenopodis]
MFFLCSKELIEMSSIYPRKATNPLSNDHVFRRARLFEPTLDVTHSDITVDGEAKLSLPSLLFEDESEWPISPIGSICKLASDRECISSHSRSNDLLASEIPHFCCDSNQFNTTSNFSRSFVRKKLPWKKPTDPIIFPLSASELDPNPTPGVRRSKRPRPCVHPGLVNLYEDRFDPETKFWYRGIYARALFPSPREIKRRQRLYNRIQAGVYSNFNYTLCFLLVELKMAQASYVIVYGTTILMIYFVW